MEKLKWDGYLRWLNRLLAGYVYKSDDIRNLAKSFGFPVISKNWEQAPRLNWFQVIDYYVQNFSADEAKQKILAFVKRVLEDQGELKPQELVMASNWTYPNAAEVELDEKTYDAKVPASDSDNFEKLMKTESTLLPAWFFELGIERSKSVGYIETDTQVGTGFLVGNNYIITNNHVIPSKEIAEKSKIEFNYEKTVQGGDKIRDTFTFDVSQAQHFATSVDHDWTIVKIKGDANTKWGQLALRSTTVKKDERVSIIQHPGGQFKQIGIHNNLVTYADHEQVMYLTDTLPGSSGSPVFNKNWDIVALHNQGGHLREPSTNRVVWRNAGISINKVIEGIQAAGVNLN